MCVSEKRVSHKSACIKRMSAGWCTKGGGIERMEERRGEGGETQSGRSAVDVVSFYIMWY